MRPTTLCFPVNAQGQILLGRKKRGFGVSKWNGFGGKIERGETFRACAVRELYEECHLIADEAALQLVAYLDFRFPADSAYNHIGYVYFLHDWKGTVMASDEMEPCWFSASSLPYDEMWKADGIWIPMILSGRIISGTIVFGDDNDSIAHTDFSDTPGLLEQTVPDTF